MGPKRLFRLGTALAALAVLSLQPAIAQAAPARVAQADAALEAAVDAVGGDDALSDLRSISYTARGEAAVFNESQVPGGPPTPAATFTLTAQYLAGSSDASDRWRLDWVRQRDASSPLREVGEVLIGRRGSIDGAYANGQPPSARVMMSDRWAAIRKQEWLLNPHLLLRRATRDDDLASDGGRRTLNGRNYRVLRIADDASPIRVYVNRSTGRIDRLRTIEHDYMRRDVDVEVIYGAWRRDSSSGVVYPRAVSLRVDGNVMHREARAAVRIDRGVERSEFAFAQGTAPTYDSDLAERGHKTSQWLNSFAQLGFPKEGLKGIVNTRVLGPGIVLLDGVPNQTLVVERASGVIVLEGAIHNHWSEAVIAFIRQTFPNKPITHVINHHHHADHASGLRPYVAAGARLITGEPARDLWEDVLGARDSTIMPDALDEASGEAGIDAVPVNGSFRLPVDATRNVTVFSDPTGFQHAPDMTATFIEDVGVMFVNGDTFNGSPTNANARPFNAFVASRGLTVTQFVSAHGPPVLYSTFLAGLG